MTWARFVASSLHALASLAAPAALAATMMVPRAARAESSVAPAIDAPATAPRTEHVWYGYQTLIADGVFLGCVAGTAATWHDKPSRTAFLAAGAITWDVAPAMVHVLHGHPWKALGDFGMRAFAPLAFLAAGAAVGRVVGPKPVPWETWTREDAKRADDTQSTGAVIGGVAGLVTVSLIDAAVLAREDVRVGAPRAKSVTAPPVEIMPSAGPTKDGFAAGLIGRF